MKNVVRCAVAIGSLLIVQGAHVSSARAQLLTQQRWVSDDGSWVSAGIFLPGDFDGNGLSDLAYVYTICEGPYGNSPTTGIDVHLSCGGVGPACPPGVPNANQWGAFATHQTWTFPSEALGIVEGGSCGIINSNNSLWTSGDWNGDGLTDVVNFQNDGNGNILITPFLSTGLDPRDPLIGAFITGTATDNQGGWVDPQYIVGGDFDGDGVYEVAYIFDDGGGISIDIHRFDPVTQSFDLGPERWVTRQGSWVGGIFQAADFNGDGIMDIGLAYEDSGQINLDAHLSCSTWSTPAYGCPGAANTFALQRWATHQGSWVTPNWWTSTPGIMPYIPPYATGYSLVSSYYSTPSDDPQAGNGAMVFAFEDYGNMSIDGHLADANNDSLSGTNGNFNLARFATRQGSWPGNGVQVIGGDFNGDTIGDVAVAFNDEGELDVDVHLGTCVGGVTSSGTCCTNPAQVCDGVCFASASDCGNPPPR